MSDGMRRIVVKKRKTASSKGKPLECSSRSRSFDRKRDAIRSSIVELSDNSLLTEVRWKSPVSQPGRCFDCSLPASSFLHDKMELWRKDCRV